MIVNRHQQNYIKRRQLHRKRESTFFHSSQTELKADVARGDVDLRLENSSVDTHTNSYGAKLNAWLIDQLTIDTPLGAYSKHKEKPTYKQFYGDAANPDYVPSSYVSPTENSTLWPAFTDANGTVWNGSVFGNVGGNDKISGGDFTATVDGQNITLGVTKQPR